MITKMIISNIGTFSNYLSIKNLSLVLIGLVKNTTPLFTALLSYLILNEGISRMEVVCLVMAFCGVGVMVEG
jgi:drug/metabolite transporter (DMT)-like permease